MVNHSRCEYSRNSKHTLNINASSDEKIRVREEFPKAVLREN